MRRLLPLTFLLFTGCADFLMHREFLAEMEHDDSRMFNPNEDFPVVAGDEGRYWMSDRERKMRTPQNPYDRENDRYNNSLKEELRSLEASQSENSAALYEKYKAKLPNVSERIYFLKLSRAERMEYLAARGLIDTAPIDSFAYGAMRHPASTVAMGMSKDEVLMSFGKPARVEIAGNPSFENERWLYTQNGSMKYIYFESGRVGGWE